MEDADKARLPLPAAESSDLRREAAATLTQLVKDWLTCRVSSDALGREGDRVLGPVENHAAATCVVDSFNRGEAREAQDDLESAKASLALALTAAASMRGEADSTAHDNPFGRQGAYEAARRELREAEARLARPRLGLVP